MTENYLADDIGNRLASASIDERIRMRLYDGTQIVEYTELSALLLSIKCKDVSLEAQNARIAALEAALKPFAERDLQDEDYPWLIAQRAARAALEKKNG